MGLFSFLGFGNINAGIEEFKRSENAYLIDVRTPMEYKEEHIPGSKNLPLDNMKGISSIVKDKSANIFVYCLSGGRSAEAKHRLNQLGYKNVKNIGGIASYQGILEGRRYHAS